MVDKADKAPNFRRQLMMRLRDMGSGDLDDDDRLALIDDIADRLLDDSRADFIEGLYREAMRHQDPAVQAGMRAVLDTFCSVYLVDEEMPHSVTVGIYGLLATDADDLVTRLGDTGALRAWAAETLGCSLARVRVGIEPLLPASVIDSVGVLTIALWNARFGAQLEIDRELDNVRMDAGPGAPTPCVLFVTVDCESLDELGDTGERIEGLSGEVAGPALTLYYDLDGRRCEAEFNVRALDAPFSVCWDHAYSHGALWLRDAVRQATAAGQTPARLELDLMIDEDEPTQDGEPAVTAVLGAQGSVEEFGDIWLGPADHAKWIVAALAAEADECGLGSVNFQGQRLGPASRH
jgi:hypothetical protein